MIKTMQKRIEEIKQADRKAYYELANEIGISEYSLYSFMTRDECSANTENKINSYLRGYLTKDEQLEAYRLDNEELLENIKRLENELKGLKDAKRRKNIKARNSTMETRIRSIGCVL